MQAAREELVRDLNRRNEVLTGELATNEAGLASERSALENERNALAKLETSYQAIQKKYQLLQRKAKAHAEEINTLKNEVNTAENNLHLLEEKQGNLETTVSELKGETQSLRDQVQRDVMEMKGLRNILSEKEGLIATLNEHQQNLEAERQQMAGLVDEKVQQNLGLAAELSARVGELDGIKASTSWKVAQLLRKVRSKVAPVEGKLTRITKKVSSIFFNPIIKTGERIRLKHDILIIKRSPLFDKEWYLVTYPDVLRGCADPAEHYMYFGAFEGRDPSKGFNSARYLRSNIDVKVAGINPLVHYLKFGKNEGRKIYDSESQGSELVITQVEPETQVTQNTSAPSKQSLDNPNETYRENTSTRDGKVPSQQLTMGNEVLTNPYAASYLELAKRHGSGKNNEYIDYQLVSRKSEDPAVKMIAFYLPQFHPIPENDEWWGKGFTEWTNVTRATPQFVGHYQPRLTGELGYYDLRVPEVQKQQIELAKNYGIYGFCFHYYWFNGRRLLEKPLEMFIEDKDNDFHFCVCWANENWTRKWDGRSRDILIAQEHDFEYDKQIIYDFIKLFRDPRYIRVDGRPLLIIYRADILKDCNSTLIYWRKKSIESGTGLPFILAAQTFGYDDPTADGFDGAVEFPPHNGEELQEINESLTILNPDYKGIVYRYDDFASASIRRIIPKPFRRFNTVFPGWDNEARQSGSGYTFEGATPEMYGKWLNAAGQFAIDHFPKNERIIFINAWNEWAEGAYLEPDRRFGYAYLQKTSEINQLLASYSKPGVHGKSSPEELDKAVYEQRAHLIKKQWPEYNLAKRYDHDILVKVLSQSIDELLGAHVVPKGEKSIASIIIPVYNHIEETLNCLKSIGMADIKTPFEIILIDDNSTDETQEIFKNCRALSYISNSENLGFLKSCNHAAQFAHGKYIVLLNNDTIVMPNWLESLIETAEKNSGTGLVGSKLVYPDGRLQEAGGLMWHDASGINFGRDDDPFKPQYNYMREADYCSAASICVPIAVWKEVDGFDELFSPAYYEDTDLAFRLRDKGYKVLYQPMSQVIHLEGVTSGTDTSTGVKRYQDVNHDKFFERWKNALKTHGDSTQNSMIYRNRSRKKHVLVIDVCTPKPDQDSGSVDTYNYLMMLRNIGFEVTFISVVDANKIDHYVHELQGKGIECITQPYLKTIEQYLEENGNFFDLVFLFRAPFGGKYIDAVRKCAPQAKIVFNTVDLHFLRELRARELAATDSEKSFELEGITEEQELGIMRKADQTIVVSEYELSLLREIDPTIRATAIGLPREIPGRSQGYEGRRDIVFIGGFLHKPNVDAVQYFVKEIWPIVHKELPQCKFLVVGSNVPPEIQELACSSIKIVGYVPDLNTIFSTCRLTVAPLRFGAGIKGKVITSLSYGVPCVATSVASEGMGLTNESSILINDNPQELARLLVKAYSNKNLWEELSNNGLDFVFNHYSLIVFQERISGLLRVLNL
jgi:GT2 family glycosyltransferase/glycosyltransferase involved in cell wall biosynthesis/predicted  nucleic acid-binding Zn-ribbon protein